MRCSFHVHLSARAHECHRARLVHVRYTSETSPQAIGRKCTIDGAAAYAAVAFDRDSVYRVEAERQLRCRCDVWVEYRWNLRALDHKPREATSVDRVMGSGVSNNKPHSQVDWLRRASYRRGQSVQSFLSIDERYSTRNLQRTSLKNFYIARSAKRSPDERSDLSSKTPSERESARWSTFRALHVSNRTKTIGVKLAVRIYIVEVHLAPKGCGASQSCHCAKFVHRV